MLLHALRTYRALLGIQRQDVHNVPILVELLLGGIAGIAVQRLVLASRQTKISSATLIKFSVLQIGGAILGVILANYIFGIEPIQFSDKDRSGTFKFVSEIFATFGLILVILLSSKEKVAMTVAAYIGGAYWFTSSTSFANPAGTIGRSFSNTFAGISPSDILHFCIAQVIGAKM